MTTPTPVAPEERAAGELRIPWRRVLAFGAVVALVLLFRACHEDYYRNRIARLVKQLDQHRSISRIQEWIADTDSQRHPSWWPECVRELKPTALEGREGGGVGLVWFHGDALGLDVFPPGRRPVRTPMFKEDYYGYHAPYGPDAYIWMRFK